MTSLSRLLATSFCIAMLPASTAFAYTLPAGTTRPSRRSVQIQGQTPSRIPVSRYPTVKDTSLSGKYRNEKFGVRIQYPGGWEVSDRPQEENNLTFVVMFLAPASRTKGALRENVNLVIEKLPNSSMTLDEYTKLGIEKEKEFFDEFTLKTDRHVLVNRFTAEQIDFTAKVNGRTIAYRQVWFIINKDVHVWTFADHPETFRSNLPLFERMMDSLQID